MTFSLHPRLAADCIVIGDFALSTVLLMNDSRYPWCILVPRRADAREIYQLNPIDRQQLLDESCLLAETMTRLYQPDKLNIAAIGNLVPQLHVHHVARFQTDAAWPAPVWGKLPALAYGNDELVAEVGKLRRGLGF